MKKLFFTLLAAMLCITASAATEVTSGSSYYVQNVASGLYLCGSNNWGTQASVSTQGDMFTLNLSDGKYELINTDLNCTNKGLGNNLFTDNSGYNWTITAVEGESGVFTISNDAGYIAQSTTAGAHIGYIAEQVTEVTDAAKWYIITADEAKEKLNAATKDAPIYASFLLGNANFSRNHDTGVWTVDASNKNLAGGDNANMCAESWCSTFTISQTLTSLPSGIYNITAQAALTDYTGAYDGADYPVVFANDKAAAFNSMEDDDRGTSMAQLSSSFSDGKYTVGPIEVVVTDGSLTIGVRGTRTNTWCIWDNFNIEYRGVDLRALKDALNAKIEEAESITGNMCTDYATALSEAITAAKGCSETKEAIETAAANLSAAMNNANASIANYAEIKTKYDALNEAGKNAFAASETGAKYLANTLKEEDWTADYEAAVKAQGNGSDMTALIINPSFELGNLTGWTSNNGGNTANNGNMPKRTGNWFVEKWTPGPATLANGTLTQTIKSLPAGIYTLTAEAHNYQQADGTVTTGGYYIVAGSQETEVTGVNGDGGKTYTVLVKVEEGGDLTIGTTLDGCTGNWVCVDNFTLSYNKYVDNQVLTDEITKATAQYNSYSSEADYAVTLKAAIDVATAANPTTIETLYDALTALQNAEKTAKNADLVAKSATLKDGDYCIQNADGRWLGAANSWGTQASLIAHPETAVLTKQSDGKYTIKSQVSNGGDSQYFNGSYMDGAATGILIAKDGDYYYLIDGNGNYYTANGNIVGTTTHQSAAKWKIYSLAEMDARMDAATATEPVDITYKLVDPRFDRNNVHAGDWERTDVTQGGDVSNLLYEAYRKTFKMQQTVKNLPEGMYEVRFNGLYRQDGSDTALPYAYANNADPVTFVVRTGTENSMAQAAISFANGLYSNSIKACVVDGKLTFGVTTEGTSCWTIFDNFQLYYLGAANDEDLLAALKYAYVIDKIDVVEGATLIDPSEYDALAVNDAIDLIASKTTTEEIKAETTALSTLDNFKSLSETYGAPLSVTYKLSAEYGTIILPVNWNIPAGWEVYSCAATNGEMLTLDQCSVATKNTPYIVHGETGTYQFIGYSYGAATEDKTVGLLTGVLTEGGSEITSGYVLQKQNGVIGFYEVTAAKTVPYAKCYLNTASEVKGFYFNQTDAIDAIEALTNGAKIYDINGRELNKLQKGINIVNGCKILVK